MFDYEKLKQVFKNKLYVEQYEETKKIFMVHLNNGNDCKKLLDCLKDASKEIRINQTIESINEEARMLKEIVSYALENNYLVYTDEEYVKNYVEDYRKIGG